MAELGKEPQLLSNGLRLSSPEQVVADAQLVFLCVPDAAVAEVCAALPWGPQHAVVHTCGALGLDALQAAHARGAAVGVFHPLASFAHGAGAVQFAGVAIGVEAAPAQSGLDTTLDEIARGLGATTFSLHGVNRAAYHAAAVLTSNYVVALHAAAARAFELAGLSATQARVALAPLTRSAADNIARAPLVDALTGPVARADVETVARHLQAIASDAQLSRTYRALGRELLSLPLPISDSARAVLAQLFAEPAS